MPNSFSDQARRIRALVVDDRLGEALQALYDLTREITPDEAGRIMPSLAAHKRLERERAEGTITAEDAHVQLARFVQTIDVLLRDLERRQPAAAPVAPPISAAAAEKVDFGIVTIREDEH